MSLLQDSDDSRRNKLAPAYIRPTYDLRGESTNVPFVLNMSATAPLGSPNPYTPDNARALFQFDNVATEADPDFWTIYVLNAYQPWLSGDNDPGDESGPDALVDMNGGQGVVVFTESIGETIRYGIANNITIPDRYK